MTHLHKHHLPGKHTFVASAEQRSVPLLQSPGRDVLQHPGHCSSRCSCLFTPESGSFCYQWGRRAYMVSILLWNLMMSLFRGEKRSSRISLVVFWGKKNESAQLREACVSVVGWSPVHIQAVRANDLWKHQGAKVTAGSEIPAMPTWVLGWLLQTTTV